MGVRTLREKGHFGAYLVVPGHAHGRYTQRYWQGAAHSDASTRLHATINVTLVTPLE